MKVFVALLLLALSGVIFAQTAQRFNEAELNDDALVRRRFNCVLDRGPCDRAGNALKAAIPVYGRNNCQKCTPQQKAQARRVLAKLQQRYPNEVAQVRAKYRV
ncbi:ejaculatory bulb-specific protein 3-like [Neocloeon triangulifer]|uniref:ejaculatory bulb-specific protein 3-like n=1 Tax=Neocloeon triangulifer TaxID=2078957 RepID=UPI00286F1A41|nr:ejaculatory bulb-specific protein 3-like [Neocloeon triangulifer]XP_059487570.1 ejaculatory bulb-specific protein 3-like [Neocloeon triangulifer]